MGGKNPIENIRLSFSRAEDWDKMTPCNSGKNCTACNKSVIDFSDKSIEELHTALSNHDQVCGRFYKSQLSPSISQNQKSFTLKRVAACVLLALGFSAFHKEVNAQSVSRDAVNHQHDTLQSEMVLGMIVETMPVYKYGGEEGMAAFLRKNLQYPKGESLHGMVVISFVIDTTGKVTDPQVVKTLSAGADEEALRVIRLLEFIPGMQAGKKVPMRYTLPVMFSDKKRRNK